MLRLRSLRIVLMFLPFISIAQIQYTDLLNQQSIFTEVPDHIKAKKPFMREWWFYEQRAFPDNYIPENAYQNSLQQRDELRLLNEQDEMTNGLFDIPSFNWVSLGPTPGAYFGYGNISSRVVSGAYDPVDPNIVYLGPANGGVWKSTNGGLSWQPLTDQQASLSMGAIEVDPNNRNIIYAGTGEATYSGTSYYGKGVLKSTDSGLTWTLNSSGLPSTTYFSRLKVRPNNSVQLLAALGNNGLYRSTNSGVSWTQILTSRVDDIVFSPTGDTAFVIGGTEGLRRSINGG